MRRVLHAAVAVLPAQEGPGIIKVALRWEGGYATRNLVRRLHRGDAAPPAWRAVLLALWEARRMRARSVVLHTDDAQAAALLAGDGPAQEGTLGTYLQARALRHAFRSVEVRPTAESGCADLPLWAAAS